MSVQINVAANQAALTASIQAGVQAYNQRFAQNNQLNLTINPRAFSQPLGRITGDVKDFEAALAASNARVIAFGASTAVLGGVIRSFKELANVTIEVEKNLADINRVFGLTTSQLQKFSTDLFNVTKQTASSFNDASQAALEFSRQGLKAEETLQRTKDALTLTRLAGVSTANAVDALTSTVNGFAATGVTTTQILNKLVAVEQDFAVGAGDLAEALSRTGQAAQEAGVSLDQLNALVTSAQQSTARGGAVIGNALKTIFTRLQRTDTLDQLEAFNISVRDVQGNILPAVTILQNFAGAYQNLADAQRAQLSEQVAGVYQVNILKAIVNDLNKSQGVYAGALQRGAMATNEAEVATAKLNQTLDALLKQTATSTQQLANNIGKVTFEPLARYGTEQLKSLVESMNEILEGEGIGSTFANGLLKGIRNILAGPGAIAAFFTLFKLIQNSFTYLSQALPQIAGITTETQNRKNIEQSILQIMAQQGPVAQALAGTMGNQAAQAQLLLQVARQQTAEYQTQTALARQLAAQLAGQGVRVRGSGGLQVTRADGYIPASTKMAEVVGAQAGGYSPGRVVPSPVGGVMNTAEDVKYIPGFAQPFINPPAASKAGRAHRQNSISRTGVDPYVARGFIPNFSDKALQAISTDKIKRNVFEKGLDFESDLYTKLDIEEEKPGKGATLDFPRGLLDVSRKKDIQSVIKSGVSNQTDYGDAKLSLNYGNITSMISKYLRQNDLDIFRDLSFSDANYSILYKNGPPDKQILNQKRLLPSLIKKNPSLFEQVGDNLLDNRSNYYKLNKKGENTKIELSFFGDRVLDQAMSKGFIPNFATPMTTASIPWFKKYSSKYKNAAGDTDLFKMGDFPTYGRGSDHEYAKKGNANMLSYLHEDFVRSALNIALGSKQVIRPSEVGFRDKPISDIANENDFDLLYRIADGSYSMLELKQDFRNISGSVTGFMNKKLANLEKENPVLAKKVSSMIAVSNRPKFTDPTGRNAGANFSEFEMAAASIVKDKYSNVDPSISTKLTKVTDGLLRRYEAKKNTTYDGFIPNFAGKDIVTKFFRTQTGPDLFSSKGTGLSGTVYKQPGYRSSGYQLKEQLNNMVMSILGNNVFFPDASSLNPKIYGDVNKGAENSAKTAALKLSSGGKTSSLGLGAGMMSEAFGNSRYVPDREAVFTGQVSGKMKRVNYDRLSDILGAFWSANPETKSAWESLKNISETGKFEEKQNIRVKTSLLKKAYEDFLVKNNYIGTRVKLNSYRKRAEGVEGVNYGALRSDLAGVSNVRNIDKYGGFIPNFAYKQAVMGLEESMSGNKAVFDTKPFPHIRNSSQPTFSSAISDHGGLSNALNDSMRNQEAAGLMSKGFVPNFATVNTQAGFGLPFGALNTSEQKLFVDMNKALSQLTRDLTLTSQQQNTLRQTILNNAYALQASTGSTDIVTEANKALTASLQQNANAQQKAATQAAQQQAAQQPVQQTLSTRLLGTSRGGKFDKVFGRLSNSIGFNLAAPLLGGVAESFIAGGKDRSEMGYGQRLASSGVSAGLTGLSTGAAIGSAIPGIGTAAGAAIGAIVGFSGAALNAKTSLEDLQKASENYRNETQTAVNSGKGIINIVKTLENLDPNSLEAFDANQKLQEYFVKISETGLDQKFKEAGNDVEKMTKAIRDYETERLAGAKRASEAESRKSKADLSIEQLAKKSGLRTEKKSVVLGEETTSMVDLLATTGTAGIANFEKLAIQNSQLFEDVSIIQKAIGKNFPDFIKVIKSEFESFEFNQDAVKNFLQGYDIQGMDVAAFAETLEIINEETGKYGKVLSGNFFEIFKAIEEGKINTAKDKAASAASAAERIESVRQRLFKYSQAIEESISKIGIQIENFQFERDFGKLNLEKSAQIINEGLSAISKNIDSAFKNQFDFLVDQTSNLQQKRLLDFEAQNFQKDLAAQTESRRLGRAKELVSVLQTALGETASDQIDTLVSQFRSTGTVDVSGIDIKSFAKGAESRRTIEAFNLTTRLADEEAKNKEDNARKIFMLEQAYANQSLKLKNETGKLDYDLSERRYKNAVREKELIDSISNQSKQIQIRGQAQIERSRIEADSPYFMLGQSEFTIADEKRRREAAATRSGFELEARQAIADAEIARIQREVLADNTNATLKNTTAIEDLIMSMTSQGNKDFLQQNETLKLIDEKIQTQEDFSPAESAYGITSNSELQNLRARREAVVSSASYAANKASSEIYNRQMETQIARKILADRKVEGGTFASMDLSTIKDPIKYLEQRSVEEKNVLQSLETQKSDLLERKKLNSLSLEESAKLKALDDQIAQQRKVVNDVDTANLTIQEKITNERKKQEQYNKDALKRGTFTTGVAKAVGAIRSETEMFKETLGTTTVNAFRDGLVGAMDAALNKADDLESALMGVAAGFLREIQGAMLRNIANQAISSFMPSFNSPAIGNQRGGIIRAQKGMYISGGRTGDKNPALLEDGEYVLNRNAVKALGGPRAIDSLNFNAFPRFATGGDPGTMSASVSMNEPFERLSMYGREQSPEFQNYVERLREEEAAREKKRAERKALLNQFIGTLISTGVSMGISSAVSAAKNSSMANANLKGATGSMSNGTTTQVTNFADAKSLIDSGGSVTLANGSVLTKSNFADGFSRSTFNEVAATRFAESGIKINSGSLFRKSSSTLMGKDYANQSIKQSFTNPAAAFGRSQSIYQFTPYKGKQQGGAIGFNQGGFLPYGSRLTDSIPAYLTGGEYVVNSKAVRKYGVGGLNRINSGVAKFQNGGMVDAETGSPSNTSNTANNNVSINITVNASGGKVGDQESDSNSEGTEGNAKELSNRIKAVVLDVITTEQRTGGLLDSTKKR